MSKVIYITYIHLRTTLTPQRYKCCKKSTFSLCTESPVNRPAVNAKQDTQLEGQRALEEAEEEMLHIPARNPPPPHPLSPPFSSPPPLLPFRQPLLCIYLLVFVWFGFFIDLLCVWVLFVSFCILYVSEITWYFSFSDLFHLASNPHCHKWHNFIFLWKSTIPLYNMCVCVTSLPIHMLMGT